MSDDLMTLEQRNKILKGIKHDDKVIMKTTMACGIKYKENEEVTFLSNIITSVVDVHRYALIERSDGRRWWCYITDFEKAKKYWER